MWLDWLVCTRTLHEGEINKEPEGPGENGAEMWLSWSVKWLETEATGNTHITCKLRQLLLRGGI